MHRFALVLGLTLTPAAAADVAVLVPDRPIERRLADGESHRYAVELPHGAWRVAVEQRGIDVVVEAFGGDGGSLAVVDLPFDRQGTETLLVETGVFEIEVRPRDAGVAAGSYRLVLARLPDDDAERLAAERAMTAAAASCARGTTEADRSALGYFRRAVAGWRRLGDRRAEALTLHAVGLVHRRLGELRYAADLFGQALESWREVGDVSFVATALNDLGLARWDLGDATAAEPLFEDAMARYRALGESYNEAAARNNLCLLYHSRGELARAGGCYRAALEVLAASPDRRLEGTLRNNLGGVHDRLGEPAEARRAFLAALELRRAAGDRHGEADTLNNLASLDRYTGRWRDALERWGRALELYRALGDRRREATALNNLGYAYLTLGEPERARSFFVEALPLRRAGEDRRGEAITLNHLGTVYRRLGDARAAADFRRQALELRRALGDRRGEARLLMWLGRDALDDDAASALKRFDDAVALFAEVDDPRNAVLAASGRGRALAALGRSGEAAAELERALARHHELADAMGEVDTRVALAEVERRRGHPDAALAHALAAAAALEGLRGGVPSPELRATFLASRRRAYEIAIDVLVDQGRPGEALTLAERARARGLLDLLAESGIDPDRGVEAALRARRRELLDRLRLAERRGGPPAPILAELDRVEAEIRRTSPAYASLTRPEPLAADGIQALLDPGVTLLQYSLGEERGTVWRVTRDSLAAHALPSRAEIEDAARRAHRELATVEVGAAARGSALAELAAMVLGPVAGDLAGERLVIAADGALHYIPFAALPAAGGEPLVVGYEVAQVPSMSALAVERRPRPSRAAVVVADPLFSGRFDPLPASRLEAEALTALLPADAISVLTGAAASREALLGGALGGARVVHLATHGVIDAARPELSGLALAGDGFLALGDVYELALDAELVVLSGCRTALGREVRGEGLVGLTRGFFYAGAPRVLASLWRVEDRATAELMARFYRALFDDGQRPATALRAAQLAVRAERRWRDPSYWAGFVLQGDWR